VAKAGPERSGQGKPIVDRLVTITLDPGHGGEDPGAVGRWRQLRKARDAGGGQAAEGQDRRRAEHARGADARYRLLCPAADARAESAPHPVRPVHFHPRRRLYAPDANGSSVFALSESGASSSAARYLAQKENEADLVGGVNLDVKDPMLARTLLDLSQTATISDSLKLGKAVLNEIGGINRLHKEHVEQAGFAVLKAPDIPSILIETAFISNPEEEKAAR
jgi:N-acetylmuramoyl-L-alanine amidase